MILVTRPSPEGEALTQLLNQANLPATHLPLFTILEGRELADLQAALNTLSSTDIIVIVSPQITHMIKAKLPNIKFPTNVSYFAVGKKSAQLFEQFTACEVSFPIKEDSEGLLELLANRALQNRKVLILRGNSGRQLLGDTLAVRQAKVRFLECYLRQPIEYANDVLMTDIATQIILITSTENLFQLDKFCQATHKRQAQLVVTSLRILEHAKRLGWQKIRLTDGANNQILFKTMTTLCHNA